MRLLTLLAALLATSTLAAARMPTIPTASTAAAEPALTTASPCAATHTLCGAASAFESAVCCPTDTSVCQRTRRSYRCVSLLEVSACDSCCNGGQCTFATGSLTATTPTDKSPSVMVPEFKTLQCCGNSEGQSFCCPTRAPKAASEHGVESGPMQPAVLVAQQCKASPRAWSCEDAPASVMHMSVSLLMWQLILCIVGGVLFCGAFGGAGHRAHSGRCSDDCQALTACCAGCALFECCKGSGGMNAPLLP